MPIPSFFPTFTNPRGGTGQNLIAGFFPYFMNPIFVVVDTVFDNFFIEVEDPEIFVTVNENT